MNGRKYALVTGGSRGIGRAVCLKLSEMGFNVLINYRSNDAEAEKHFRQAAAMCPVRFVPLYRLVKLLEKTGRHEEALRLAEELSEKPVKVSSYIVEKIKREMNDFLRCNQN